VARCFYCANALDASPEPEHVLPAAINADLTTRRVCTPCNHWAGTEVDHPWLGSHLVRECRHRWNVPDRYGRTVPEIAYKGKLNDGDDALVTIDGSDVRIRRIPKQVEDGQSITFTGYDQTEFDRAVLRLQQRHPQLVAPKELTVIETTFTATVNLEASVHIWPRFAAKVALGVASLVVDDSWLDTPTAIELRDVLQNGHPASELAALDHPGVAWSAVPFELVAGTHMLLPPQHLLTFETTAEEGDWLVIVVFGELVYRLPLNPLWGDATPQSWLFGPTTPQPRQLPPAVQYVITSLENGWSGPG
jgi:hypothetical protein